MSNRHSSQGRGVAPDPDEILRETAALWYDRLNRDKVPEETRADFARWRDERPEHRAAYESASRAWTLVQQSRHQADIMALRHEMALRLTRRFSRWSFVSVRIAAAAAVVAVAVALTVTLKIRGTSGEPDRYSTATGERLEVTLPDGSQLTLNTQTRIKTVYTAEERKILLEQGQALFEVAKDPSRPFVVVAQGRHFVAVGTAFDVRVERHRVQVTMVEGTVKVSDDRNPILLSAGQQLTLDSTAIDPTPSLVRAADAARATSWRQGQLIFENTSLAEAIGELNRYSETKVELSDPALAGLKLSGAFATGRTAVFVEALTTYFPVKVVRSDNQAIVLGAR